jgi:hypothetical protein
MIRSSHHFARPLRLFIQCLVGVSLVCGVASASGWDGNDPAEATAGDMEDHMAGSGDPDEMEATSKDPNDLEAHSEDPDDLEVSSEQLEDHVAQTEALADHEGTSYELSELKNSSPDDGFDPIEMPGQNEWGPSSDPLVIVARRHLERAQEQARAARSNYGQMMQNDYPRGAARIRIVEARDAAEEKLAEAKAAIISLDGGGPAAAGQ